MKLEKPDFFNYCFNSNRTIKDALKKWSAFSVEEELAYLKENRYVLFIDFKMNSRNMKEIES